jgi:TolB-like protein
LPLVFLCVCSVSFAQAVTIDTAIQTAGDYLIAHLPGNSKIALLNIESGTPKISMYIAEELSAILVNSRLLTVVDRDNMDIIRREEQYQMSGEVSDETAQRIGQKLGAQTVITGSFVRIGSQYRMRIRATEVETARVQALTTVSVQRDRILRGLERDDPDSPGGGVYRNALHDPHRLYLGARAGLSLGFYENGGGLLDKTVYPAQALNGAPAFNAAVYAAVPVWSLFALQAEAAVTGDAFELLSGNTSIMTVSYNSLMIPLLAKLVFRPSIFTVQGYAGPYLGLPWGMMEVAHQGGAYKAEFPFVAGFTAGGGGGVKLGPGYVMADIRYSGDFGYVTARYNGSRAVSRSGKVFFTLGYEFGLVPK